ncbi:MAG TPA: hypothetical protein VK403_03555 [Allosphingosinicella sp.]|nr:hypothetical protein [Allosphingosinicella sp.]
MRDEIDSRIWADHGGAFSEELARFFANLGTGLRRLNEIQFDAPWKRGAGRRGQA